MGLCDVRENLISFAETLIFAHGDDHTHEVPAAQLLRCFESWQRAFGVGYRLELSPARSGAHPNGRFCRDYHPEASRSVCLDHGCRLIIPGRLAGNYKVNGGSCCVAVLLRFAEDAPRVELKGREYPIESMVLDPHRVTLELVGHAELVFLVDS